MNALWTGAALGALGMYLIDPENGSARRAQVRGRWLRTREELMKERDGSGVWPAALGGGAASGRGRKSAVIDRPPAVSATRSWVWKTLLAGGIAAAAAGAALVVAARKR